MQLERLTGEQINSMGIRFHQKLYASVIICLNF